jgi:hypothetical protein
MQTVLVVIIFIGTLSFTGYRSLKTIAGLIAVDNG